VIVVTQEPAEAFTAFDLAPITCHLPVTLDDLASCPLVIALAVIMLDVVPDSPFKRGDAKEDHAVQALVLDGSDEPLSLGGAVRSLCLTAYGTDSGFSDHVDEGVAVLAITVDD